ncbi:MAG: beta-ketoacyl synthase N-terminal-like domain-containing protein [Pirellula sp.]
MRSDDYSPQDEIVVTGYGALTPLGHSPSLLYDALLSGKSGVRLIEPVQGIDGVLWMAADVENFDGKEHVQPRKATKLMSRDIQMAFGAALQACKSASIVAGGIAPDRLGTVFTGEIICGEVADVESIVRRCASQGTMDHSQWAVESMENMYPLWMLKALPNMAACHVGIAIDARGPNNTITTEGTSGLGAAIEAVNVIRRGKADVMIVGSSASRTSFTRLLQRYERDYSKSYTDPATACKPFDARRDGTVPAESATAIVLERRSHAEARNVPIFGTLVSWANTFTPATEPWGSAQVSTEQTIALLLERGKLSKRDIDHINSAANGTLPLDAGQAKGIANLLSDVPVVSYKGALGDSISGSSVVEWIASIAGMRRGAIAPTTNHLETAADCPIQVIHGSAKPITASTFIKLSNTRQGHCVGIAMTM